MCWYRKWRKIGVAAGGAVLLSGFLACQRPDRDSSSLTYFDLKGYFQREVQRLEQQQPALEKRVWKNGVQDSARINDIPWKEELALFSESDINKPSWSQSYQREIKGDTLIYTTRDSTLMTRRIAIVESGGIVRSIQILNRVSNPLYVSETRLSYFPDSLYRINKTQDVRFLDRNHYRIEGRMLPRVSGKK